MSSPNASDTTPSPGCREQRPCSAFVVGLPDTRGIYCWLAGYKGGDPVRYYTADTAKRFKTRDAAKRGIRQARNTHPLRDRRYIIVPESEMHRYMEPNTPIQPHEGLSLIHI